MSNWENHKHSTWDKRRRRADKDGGVKHWESEAVRKRERYKGKTKTESKIGQIKDALPFSELHRHISLIHANQCGCQLLRHGHNGPFMLGEAQHSSWSLQGNNYWTYPAGTLCLWLQRLSTPTFKWQWLDNTGISTKMSLCFILRLCTHTPFPLIDSYFEFHSVSSLSTAKHQQMNSVGGDVCRVLHVIMHIKIP